MSRFCPENMDHLVLMKKTKFGTNNQFVVCDKFRQAQLFQRHNVLVNIDNHDKQMQKVFQFL